MSGATAVVLDSSALLAWLFREAGAEPVGAVLAQAMMSSLNWSEVCQKALERGLEVTELRANLEAQGFEIVAFDKNDAEHAARLWKAGSGLSLADRACLALGIRYGKPVYTADRLWPAASPGAEVRLIRT